MWILSKNKHFFSDFGQEIGVGLEEVVEGFGGGKSRGS